MILSHYINILTIVILLFVIHFSHSNTIVNYEVKLHEYLFSAEQNHTAVYDANIRPVRNNDRINIEVRLGIKRIFELDEINHQVTLFAVLIKRWQDEFLKWNPKDYGNITYTYVDYRKIWTPQFSLVSKIIEEEKIDKNFHDIYEKFPVKLFSNGKVEFVPSLHLRSECLFNYRLFPFEFQMCDFYFQMPYSLEHISLRMGTFYTMELHQYDPLWTIENLEQIDTLDSGKDPISIVRIRFRRTVKGYLYTMPSYIVYILTLLMFLLPQNSNQRIIIGSTCLLISTILSFMMAKELPHDNISQWPVLGKLYLFNIVLMTFSLLFSALILNISNCEHAKAVPDWLKKLTVNVLAKLFCVQAIAYTVFNSYSFKVHDEENSEQINNMLLMSSIDDDTSVRVRYHKLENSDEQTNIESSPVEKSTNSETENIKKPTKYGLTKILKRIYTHVEQLRDKLQINTYKKCASNEWLLVAILFDKILFFLYCFIVVTVTMFIFKK